MMIECPSCGESEELRGVALADGRRQIMCGRCGHTWTRGTATQQPAPRPAVRRRTTSNAADCGPSWNDEPTLATLNRHAPTFETSGPDSVPVSLAPRREPTWTLGSPVTTKRAFSYIVVHDSGFSPNPFHGLLTLACCKPLIRRTAEAGDIIVGLSSRSERVVYAVQVAEVIGFEEYWADPEYQARRPLMRSPQIINRTGDNIYEPVSGGYRQLPSFHSNPDGTENADLKRTDLGGDHVLVGERFTYWGRSGPSLPEELEFLAVGRGHRSNFTHEQVNTVAHWFADLPGGVLGAPAQWKVGDQSWRQP